MTPDQITALIERLRSHHRLDIVDFDLYVDAADALAALHADNARLSVCKLCNSTGNDTPCAYPTEINRQQATQLAALQAENAGLRMEKDQQILEWTRVCREIIRRCVASNMERAAFAMLQKAVDEAVVKESK